MKQQSIRISIPQPCHESWESMDATACGAFCHSCQKEVVDFTTMTDSSVISYQESHPIGCGKFRNDQIDTKLIIPVLDNGVFRWKALVLSLLSLFSLKHSVFAQKVSIPVTEQIAKDSIQTKTAHDTCSQFEFMSTLVKTKQPFYFTLGGYRGYKSNPLKNNNYWPSVENISIKEDEEKDTILSK